MKTLLVCCLLTVLAPALAFGQKAVPLDPAQHKKLNVFFSNFGETNLESFTRDALTDKAMLQFATWHCLMNLANTFAKTKDGNRILIPAATLDKVTEKYFGKKVAAHAKPTYVEEMATGEAYVFSQVDTLTDQGDGTFLAKGTIYYAGSGATPDPHATRAAWKKAGEDVRVYGSFSGLIRRSEADKERYVLLEYTMTPK